MTRTAFKQCDVERALKAGRRAGVAVSVRIERRTGDLIIVPVDGPGPAALPDEADLDAELAALLTDES